jgi:hypothetical protein
VRTVIVPFGYSETQMESILRDGICLDYE